MVSKKDAAERVEYYRNRCVLLEDELEKKNKILQLMELAEHEDFVISYSVQWKTVQFPANWELYSANTTDPQSAINSYEAALKNPVCIDARFVERMMLRREISPEEMLLRRPRGKKREMKTPIPAEGFGRSPKIAMK